MYKTAFIFLLITKRKCC